MTQLHRLSSAFVKSAPYGKHSDGQGLWLIKRTDGGAQWVLRISLGGKRREMGLGSANDVSLKEARELASEYRKLAKQGIDPINFRLAEKRALLKATNKTKLYFQLNNFNIINSLPYPGSKCIQWRIALKAFWPNKVVRAYSRWF